MVSFSYLPRAILPETQNGCGWGRKRDVLIRRGEKFLFRRPGHPTWSGTGMPWRYTPTCFVLIDYADRFHTMGHRLWDGRLSRQKLIQHSLEINEFFRCDATEQFLKNALKPKLMVDIIEHGPERVSAKTGKPQRTRRR